MLGRNVRWPRRMLPLVSHVEYVPRAVLGLEKRVRQTDGQTDRRTPDRHIALTLASRRGGIVTVSRA